MSTSTPGNAQGGLSNVLPGRAFPEHGQAGSRIGGNFEGGARGPAALPSRSVRNPGGGPAPVDPRPGGNHGTIAYHRGAFVEDAGAPRLNYDGELGHNAIPWSRPVYPNIAGHAMYHAPTQMPSWSANATLAPQQAASPIPVQKKKIGSFTVREEYGSTRQFFYNGSLANVVAGLQVGMRVQGRRWIAGAKTHSPSLYNLAKYATAGSYGQTTTALDTAPSNVPIGGTPGANPYGSY